MGYFETYCNSNEAKIINERLIQMYTTWHNNWVDKEKDINTQYYHPTLLTCTDAYLDRRIMMFGKEAHVKQKGFVWLEGDNGEKGYFTNSWYTYNETIFNGISQRGVMTNTDYLKTRKIIAGLVNYDDIKGLQNDMIGRKQFTSVIVNNLNKTSINGDSAKVNEANELYKPFKFGNNIFTIYQHELSILKPKKIVLCCGRGYNDHILRDINYEKNKNILEDKIKKIRKQILNSFGISEGKHPFIDEICFNEEETYKLFGYREKLSVLLTMHPSAHMNKNVRDEYIDKIKTFVKLA